MAITWGDWEDSGSNGMRVGIEVVWTLPVAHTDASVDADVVVYTENRQSYSDGQKLTYGGSIDGSQSFTNNQGSLIVTQRDNVDYDHTYGSTEYGVSPGSRTFSATLSGAYNGVTPSVSVSAAIPARPYAAPAAPTSVALARASDASAITSWARNATAGEPYTTQGIQRSVNGGSFATLSLGVAGSATSYNDTTVGANAKYRYQVRAQNSAGNSTFVQSGDIWTTPAAPSAPLRSGLNGANQVLTWTNNVGYPANTEWQTEVWRSDDNAAYALLTTVAGSLATYTDTFPATHPATKFKYVFRAKTTNGAVLYSAFSAETTQTSGTTTPPLAPTNLSPNGIVVDPSQATTLTWTFNPGQVGDTQAQYQIRHRLNGTSTWTTPAAVVSPTAQGSLAINTYADGNIVEWQVSTKGADATFSPWSNSAIYTNTVTVLTPPPIIYPADIDVTSGQVRANSAFNEVRDYLIRTQAQLFGGGLISVDASYNIGWTSRFIAISFGRTVNTANGGFFNIVPPSAYTVTNKQANGSQAILTVATHKLRVGETVTVAGVDATFNGSYVIRSTTNTTITYDLAATVGSTAATGTIAPKIKGHGGASDTAPTTASLVPIVATWYALYYELPMGWGAGSTPRKNGVVTVTTKALTTNVATLTVLAPHYFAVGDQVTVAIGDAVFDGTFILTGVGLNTITYAKTNANVGSTAVPSGYAKPAGSDTLFGNFHLVHYSGFFTVPSSWVLIAMRNGDSGRIEWGTGEKIEASGSSNQITVGDLAGGNLVINGNQVRARTGTAESGNLFFQYATAGDVHIGDTSTAGIYCPMMSMDDSWDPTNQVAYSSTTQTPGSPVVGLTFKAPPSGTIAFEVKCSLTMSAVGIDARVYGELKTGTTVGSGTLIQSTGDSDTGPQIRLQCNTAGETMNAASGLTYITGLTPLADYNVCLRHRLGGGTGSITVLNRRITVIPST